MMKKYNDDNNNRLFIIDYFEIGKLYKLTKSCVLYSAKDHMDKKLNNIYTSFSPGTYMLNLEHTSSCKSGSFCIVLDCDIKYEDNFEYARVKILIGERVGWVLDWSNKNSILKRVQ